MNKTFLDWISNDFWYIFLVLLALFACIWTLGHTKEYINECNRHWERQIDDFIKEGYCVFLSKESKALIVPYILPNETAIKES